MNSQPEKIVGRAPTPSAVIVTHSISFTACFMQKQWTASAQVGTRRNQGSIFLAANSFAPTYISSVRSTSR